MAESDLLKLAGVQAWMDEEIDYFDLPDSTRDALFEFYHIDMPHGVQKARTGDPDAWIMNRLERLVK